MTTDDILLQLATPPAGILAQSSRRIGGHASGAWLDAASLYRFLLWRTWGDGGRLVLFMCLNPSTATAYKDDPTVLRLTRRAEMRGYDGLLVANLFAWRATDPFDLESVRWPSSPVEFPAANDEAIIAAHRLAEMTVCAWGTGQMQRESCERVRHLLHLAQPRPLYHLGLTKDGQPRHPLYLSYSVEPQVWEVQP